MMWVTDLYDSYEYIYFIAQIQFEDDYWRYNSINNKGINTVLRKLI